MTRLIIVDDHPVLREGLRLLLAQETSLQMVGEASNGQELLELQPTLPADVVLLDMNMPVLDGIATATRLRAEYPALRVLMLSMVDNPRSIQQALAAGADGYILKNADKSEIITAIQMVVGGKRFLCSEIGLHLLELLHGGPAPAAPAAPAEALSANGPRAALSRREQEILRLVAEGLTTQQIADQLFTSKRTVETHRQNLLEKTGCNNTAALIRYAMTHGYLSAGGT